VYEELPGWWEDISKARTEADLPVTARRYIDRIEELCGARVSVVGVGPGREENVIRHPLLP
jgi:adenylosuccinate synthase